MMLAETSLSYSKMWSCRLSCLLILTVTSSAHGRVVAPKLGNYRYVQEGDVTIGAMLGIHQYSPTNYCSDVAPADWVIGPEAFIFAVNEINKRKDILPNVTLGLLIMDDCEKDTTALACATQLVPTTPESDSTPTCERQPADSTSLLGLGNATVSSPASGERPVVGMVGPDYSRSAVMISGLLGLFSIPVLGTFTTSDELSDKARYPYFSRLVPPDVFLTRAMMDIAEAFNWTYISVVYGEGSYGQNAARQVERMAKKMSTCLAVSLRVPSGSGSREFDRIAAQLIMNKKARAVILIGETHILAGVLEALDTHMGRLTINAIHIDHPNGIVPGFASYFRNLAPSTKPTRPWMKAFWEETMNCEWEKDPVTSNPNETNGSRKNCTDVKNMGNYTIENWFISKYVDGINVFAEALDALINEFCPKESNKRDILNHCITSERLLKSIRNVSIAGNSDSISFDSNGDMYGSYHINQLQLREGKIRNMIVGKWSRKGGVVSMEGVEWVSNVERYPVHVSNSSPMSVCSQPCQPKEYVVYSEIACCWTCRECRANERLVKNGTACEPCETLTWPNHETAQTCEPIMPHYMSMSVNDPIGVGLFSAALCGSILTLGTLVDYGLKRNNNLVKATSRELSTVILLGALTADIVVLTSVVKPSRLICTLQDVGFHASTFLMNCPLMLKTIRIFRIIKESKKGPSKIRFLSSKFQIAVVLSSTIMQMCILGAVQALWPSNIEHQMPNAMERYAELFCDRPLPGFLVPLSVTLACIVVCAVFGFLSRKFPENYNESWYIFVSVSTTLFMWIVILPTYFSTFFVGHRVTLLGICLLINGFITVVFQFIPKLYAVRYVAVDNMKVHLIATANSVVPISVAPADSNVSSTIELRCDRSQHRKVHRNTLQI